MISLGEIYDIFNKSLCHAWARSATSNTLMLKNILTYGFPSSFVWRHHFVCARRCDENTLVVEEKGLKYRREVLRFKMDGNENRMVEVQSAILLRVNEAQTQVFRHPLPRYDCCWLVQKSIMFNSWPPAFTVLGPRYMWKLTGIGRWKGFIGWRLSTWFLSVRQVAHIDTWDSLSVCRRAS